MKKLIAALLMVLFVTGLSYAQTTLSGKPTNTDGTVFTVTRTQEKPTGSGGSTLVTKVKTVGGPLARVDAVFNDVDGSLQSIEFYLYAQKGSTLNHVMSCDGADFVAIAAHVNQPPPATYSQTTKAIALCSFNPDGLGTATDGVGYLDMTGTMYYVNTSPVPTKIKITSAKIGGAYFVVAPDQPKLVVKGTFAATLK
jgi:hypothetical protein